MDETYTLPDYAKDLGLVGELTISSVSLLTCFVKAAMLSSTQQYQLHPFAVVFCASVTTIEERITSDRYTHRNLEAH
jgi:hypothetical protein